jgi:hypothetical protein
MQAENLRLNTGRVTTLAFTLAVPNSTELNVEKLLAYQRDHKNSNTPSYIPLYFRLGG